MSFLLPSHASLHKSKTTLDVLEYLFSLCHLQLPTLQESVTKSPAAPPGIAPCPWEAMPVVEVAVPALPRAGELPWAPLLSSPLLCLLRWRRAVLLAASPAPAPNALTTAVGLIIKITF